MSDKVRCSECNERFATRGFHSHNRAMHGGEADGLAPEPDADAPDDGPADAPADGDDGAADAPDDGADAGPADLDADGDDGGGDHADAFEDDDNEVEGDPEAGDVTDEVEDEEADSRYPYQCGNCGHGLEYLGGDDREAGGKKCPECDERLFWSKVEA
jgi:DNA-directed RNA polymerase subunit RPC12/RpoP